MMNAAPYRYQRSQTEELAYSYAREDEDVGYFYAREAHGRARIERVYRRPAQHLEKRYKREEV